MPELYQATMIIIHYNNMAFQEIAQSLAEVLTDQNLPVQVTNHDLGPEVTEDHGNLYIILGLNNPMPYLPPRYFAYQLEQTGNTDDSWFNEVYLQNLHHAERIWDYSMVNIRNLRQTEQFKQIGYVPLGYVRGLDPSHSDYWYAETEANRLGFQIPDGEKPIDILFYGSLNDRRRKILEQIQQERPDWNVKIANYNLWNEERQKLIAQSKIVVNLHYYSHPILETSRLTVLLNQGAMVVSEHSLDPILDNDYRNWVAFTEKTSVAKTSGAKDDSDSSDDSEDDETITLVASLMVETCQKYLDDSEMRRDYARNAYIGFKERTYARSVPTKDLKPVLDEMSKIEGSAGGLTSDGVGVKCPFRCAQVEVTDQGAVLKLSPDCAEDYVPVSIVTPTYRRGDLFPIALRNFRRFNYPPELIEWIIVEDTESGYPKAKYLLPSGDGRIKHIRLSEKTPLWEKRNIAVQEASHDIIIHMDDDDYYYPDSIYAKVKLLRKYGPEGIKCLGARELGIYQMMENKSYIMGTQMLSEASMAYTKDFWRERPFQDKELHLGEGAAFIRGRESQVLDFPYAFNLIALTHRSNVTGPLRQQLEKSKGNSDISPSGGRYTNFFNLWDWDTQLFFLGLIKKLRKRE